MDTQYTPSSLDSAFDDLLSGCFPEELPPPSQLEEHSLTSLPVSCKRPHNQTNLWDPRLILDLAVDVDGLPEILLRYGLSIEEYNMLSETQAFRRELALAMREIRENGVSFSNKAKIQAESYLSIVDELVYSNETPASVRLEAIRSAVKWGKLEPKEDKAGDSGNQQTINVQINF